MRSITLAEVLKAHSAATLEGVHTAIPGRVVKYDADNGWADIAPTTKQPIRSGEQGEEIEWVLYPTFPNVPVAWPSGGGYFVGMPLAVGDPVLLTFSEVGLAEYLTTGEDSEPLDTRRHSLGYPLAFPGGARPETKALKDLPTDGVIVGKDDSTLQIKVDATVITLGKGATDFVALASKVDSNLAIIGAILTAMASAGGTNPALNAAWAATVAATKVKAL